MKINTALKLALKRVLSLQFGELAGLIFDGEMLAVGMEVFVKGEGEEVIPAPDGEYESEDGRVIVVANGAVAEIKDAPEAEVVEVVEEMVEETTEPAADPVDAPEIEDEVTVESRVEALEGRIAEMAQGIADLVAAMDALNGKLAEIEGKLAKLETEPAADPVEEEHLEEVSKSKLSYLRK